jgi:hypothetical protein
MICTRIKLFESDKPTDWAYMIKVKELPYEAGRILLQV